MFQEQNPISAADGREAVRDVDRGAAPRQRMDPFEELVLRLGVERGGRLIQQEDARVAHEGARQRNFLPLAP